MDPEVVNKRPKKLVANLALDSEIMKVKSASAIK